MLTTDTIKALVVQGFYFCAKNIQKLPDFSILKLSLEKNEIQLKGE
jgi:hypothetical protein